MFTLRSGHCDTLPFVQPCKTPLSPWVGFLLAWHELPAYITRLINSISCRLRQLLKARCCTWVCDDREVIANIAADSCWCKIHLQGSNSESYVMVLMKAATRYLHRPEAAGSLNTNTWVTRTCARCDVCVNTYWCVCWTLAFIACWCFSCGTL